MNQFWKVIQSYDESTVSGKWRVGYFWPCKIHTLFSALAGWGKNGKLDSWQCGRFSFDVKSEKSVPFCTCQK